jgi:hypothetical protein
MFKKIALWSILPMIVATVTAYTVLSQFESAGPRSGLFRNSSDAVARPSPNKIRAGALWPQLRGYLKALGGRIEESGKERLTLGGTLNRAGEQGVTFAAISEFPDRLRFVTQTGAQARVIKFYGQSLDSTLSAAEQDLVQSLVNDSAEHFFKAQAQGAPTRHLGDRFRADDGSIENYTGPYHDIFLMQDTLTIGSEKRSPTKLYYFDSETRLLEKVTYQISRGGQTVDIETRSSEWQKIQGQQVAHRIVRLENGQEVMSLMITTAAVSARVDDGLF